MGPKQGAERARIGAGVVPGGGRAGDSPWCLGVSGKNWPDLAGFGAAGRGARRAVWREVKIR